MQGSRCQALAFFRIRNGQSRHATCDCNRLTPSCGGTLPCHGRPDLIEKGMDVIVPEGMMRPKTTGSNDHKIQRAWEPPALTKLAIGTETKSAADDSRAISVRLTSSQPQPPAPPETKLGFSVEWAFPLSARVER